MPATVEWDKIQGSAYEYSTGITAISRGGIVKGLDTSIPYAVLDNAYAAIRAEAAPGSLHPNHSANWLMTLRQIRIVPIANDQCRFQAVYTDEWNGPQVCYFINDETYLTQYNGNRVPGTSIYPKISCQIDAKPENSVPEDYINISCLRPMRAIRAYGLLFGEPDNTQDMAGGMGIGTFRGWTNKTNVTAGDMVGAVNNAPWMGLPRGYWLITKHATDRSVYNGYYRYEVTAMTKQDEDWRETAILYSKMVGKYAMIDPDPDVADIVLQGLYDIPWPDRPGVAYYDNDRTWGVCAVFPYKVVNFDSVFGFSS